MLSEISVTLNLEDPCMKNKFVFATKDEMSDLNFVFADVLTFYTKKNYSLIIVNFAQSYSHYSHLLLKSGVNVRVLRDQQKITVIDFLSEVPKLINSNQTEENSYRNETSLISVLLNYESNECLKVLYRNVVKAVEAIKNVGKSEGFVLFIDEISLLMNLGLSLQAIQPFIRSCYSLCLGVISPSVLFVGSVYEEADEENVKFVNYLCHLSDIQIEVRGLKTGYSREADGKISLEVKNKTNCSVNSHKMLFKVTDKGVKLLTLGL